MVTKKSKKEIEILRRGGTILAAALRAAAAAAKPGVRTEEIDALVERHIREHDGEPSFKGYRPGGARRAYPSATCISVNETVVHGLPSDYILRGGDVVKIDAGVLYGGLYTDSAVTVGVGKISKEAKLLMSATKKALEEGIKAARVGNTTGDIGHVIERRAAKQNLAVIKNLTGHGVGYAVHEDPIIFNFGNPGTGVRLEEGMVIAIEPMFSISSQHVMQMDDDSFVTHDGSLSAQFEHTVAITARGPLVLTK